MVWDGGEDVVRTVFTSLYFISGTVTMIFCLVIYRHNQRNKSRRYRTRYQSYINTLAVLALAMWITGVGKLTSILDLLNRDGNQSQYGWWIAHGVHTVLLVFAMSAYHRLTIFGILLAGMMASFEAVSSSLLSVSDSVEGWALAGSLAGLSILFSHFFVWWKGKREYETIEGTSTVLGGRVSYRVVDIVLVVVSAILSLLLLMFLILGPEVTHEIPVLATEIVQGVLVQSNWMFVTIVIFFWFMDVHPTKPGKGSKKGGYDWSKDGRGPNAVHRSFSPFDDL